MSKTSNRIHRSLVFLAHVQQYTTYGPLIGPKEMHQPDYRWLSSTPGESSGDDDQHD